MKKLIYLLSVILLLASCSKDEADSLYWEGDAIGGIRTLQEGGVGPTYVRYFVHMDWGWVEVDVQSAYGGQSSFEWLAHTEVGDETLCHNKIHNIRISGFQYGQTYLNINKTPGATFEVVTREMWDVDVIIRTDRQDWDVYYDGDLTALRYSIVSYKSYKN